MFNLILKPYFSISIPHENGLFSSSFNANYHHHCQLANSTGSTNYQADLNGFNNHPFHSMNGYRTGLAHQSANHHHLHHHLHQQTYHLIINNSSTNNIDSSTHYHLDPQENCSAPINHSNLNNNLILPFQQHNELVNSNQTDYRKCDQLSNESNQENKNGYYIPNEDPIY